MKYRKFVILNFVFMKGGSARRNAGGRVALDSVLEKNKGEVKSPVIMAPQEVRHWDDSSPISKKNSTEIAIDNHQ